MLRRDRIGEKHNKSERRKGRNSGIRLKWNYAGHNTKTLGGIN